jgi:hypothetical protein
MSAPSVDLHDLGAEEAALAAALQNDSALKHALTHLHEEDFWSPDKRKLFVAMAKLHAAGEPVDAITVKSAIRANGAKPEDTRRLCDLVGHLDDTIVVAANVPAYADAIRKQTEARQIQVAQAAESVPIGTVPHSYTAPEIAAMEFTDPDPLLLYAERGCTFDLVGKAKKGKTTFLLLGCKAVLREEPFLDLPTKRVPILYLTEQTRRSFKMKLAAMGLTGETDLHIAFRTDFKSKSWDEICEWIAAEVAKWGIGLLPIDTLSDWAKIRDENDNGEALRVTAPLRDIAEAKNVAVITARHAGKGEHESRDVVDLGRGASAFAGAADVVCTLGSAPGSGHPNRRQLRYEGRPDDLPAAVIIELRDGRYESLGGAPSIEYQTARTFVSERLASTEAAAITQTNILNACDGQFSRRTLQRALNDLMAEGVVTGKIGVGTASGKAFGYWLPTGGHTAEDFGF